MGHDQDHPVGALVGVVDGADSVDVSGAPGSEGSGEPAGIGGCVVGVVVDGAESICCGDGTGSGVAPAGAGAGDPDGAGSVDGEVGAGRVVCESGTGAPSAEAGTGDAPPGSEFGVEPPSPEGAPGVTPAGASPRGVPFPSAGIGPGREGPPAGFPAVVGGAGSAPGR